MLRYAKLRTNKGIQFYDLDEDRTVSGIGGRIYPDWSSLQWRPMLIKYQGNDPYASVDNIEAEIRTRFKYVLRFNEGELKRDLSEIGKIKGKLYRDPNNKVLLKELSERERSRAILETEIPDIRAKLSRLNVILFRSPRTGVTGFKVIF